MGLGLLWIAGLPKGKEGFSSNGLLVSAEKASLRLLTCACISGMGQFGMHCSRILMWRTKKSLASPLSSGSGEVMATFLTVRNKIYDKLRGCLTR